MADIPTDEVLTNEDDRPRERRSFSFECTVEVWDEKQLQHAAYVQYFKEHPGATSRDADELLGRLTAPNVRACIQMLLDQSMPGATILGSDATEFDHG